MARVEIAPGGRAGRHTHPGDEISYVLAGQTELLIDGKPACTLKAGESFVIPAGDSGLTLRLHLRRQQLAVYQAP